MCPDGNLPRALPVANTVPGAYVQLSQWHCGLSRWHRELRGNNYNRLFYLQSHARHSGSSGQKSTCFWLRHEALRATEGSILGGFAAGPMQFLGI
jgi:hypothetical protein